MANYGRQLDILSPTDMEGRQVTLIGCGGIGSPTAIVLAKMGIPSLVLYDDDKIEEHNFPNQMYAVNQLGMSKVSALGKLCKAYAPECETQTIRKKFDAQVAVSEKIVVVGVDSMTARHDIWYTIGDDKPPALYIDARMGGQQGMIYTFNPQDADAREWYEGTLYPDHEAVAEPCTARAIIYNTFIIAGLIGNQVKQFIRKEEYKRTIVFNLQSNIFIAE